MTHEQRGVWVNTLMSIAAYAVYLILVLPQLFSRPLDDVDYVPALLWTIGGSIVAAIVVSIVVGIFSRRHEKGDRRDKQIERFGEYYGRGFIIFIALGALVLAIIGAHTFWIANLIYLGFVLSTILAGIIKLSAYRGTFQPW
jgi:MFS family permease